MRFFRPLLLLFSVLFFFSCAKQKLELQLSPGKTYSQSLFADKHFIQNFNGQKLDIHIKTGGELELSVKNYVSNVYNLTATYKSLSFSMIFPTNTVDFHSEKKDTSDVYSTVLSNMVNKPFQLKINHLGKIKEIKGLNQICDQAFDKIKNLNEVQKLQMKTQLLTFLGEQALKENMEIITAFYTGETMGKGDTWNVKTQTKNVLPEEINSVYKITDFKNNSCNIAASSKLKTLQTLSQLPMNNIPVKYTVKGEMNSEISLDKATGWINNAKITKKLSGNAFVQNNPQIPAGMRIPVTVESIYTVGK